MADINFGIFWLAHTVQETERLMLLRLLPARALKVLSGKGLGAGRRRKVEWKASVFDRKVHPKLPEGAVVKGWIGGLPAPRGERRDAVLFHDPGSEAQADPGVINCAGISKRIFAA